MAMCAGKSLHVYYHPDEKGRNSIQNKVQHSQEDEQNSKIDLQMQEEHEGSKVTLPKPSPKLDKEDFIGNQFTRFLKQVETREV